jgi:hypothetical protein
LSSDHLVIYHLHLLMRMSTVHFLSLLARQGAPLWLQNGQCVFIGFMPCPIFFISFLYLFYDILDPRMCVCVCVCFRTDVSFFDKNSLHSGGKMFLSSAKMINKVLFFLKLCLQFQKHISCDFSFLSVNCKTDFERWHRMAASSS